VDPKTFSRRRFALAVAASLLSCAVLACSSSERTWSNPNAYGTHAGGQGNNAGGAGGHGADHSSWPPRDDAAADPATVALALAYDESQQTFWIGTEAGLVKVVDGTAASERYTTANSGLAHDAVQTVAVDSTGDLWIVYGNGHCLDDADDSNFCGLSRRSNGSAQWQTFMASQTNRLDDRVYVVYAMPTGGVLVGTYTAAATTSNGTGYGAYFDWHDCNIPGDHCQPLWSYVVGDFTVTSDNTWWVAVDLMQIGISPKPGGIARRNADGTTDSWNLSHGVVHSHTTSIALTSQAVFAANVHGLLRFVPTEQR